MAYFRGDEATKHFLSRGSNLFFLLCTKCSVPSLPLFRSHIDLRRRQSELLVPPNRQHRNHDPHHLCKIVWDALDSSLISSAHHMLVEAHEWRRRRCHGVIITHQVPIACCCCRRCFRSIYPIRIFLASIPLLDGSGFERQQPDVVRILLHYFFYDGSYCAAYLCDSREFFFNDIQVNCA